MLVRRALNPLCCTKRLWLFILSLLMLNVSKWHHLRHLFSGPQPIHQFNSIQFICIAGQFHKLQICLGVLYNLYT